MTPSRAWCAASTLLTRFSEMVRPGEGRGLEKQSGLQLAIRKWAVGQGWDSLSQGVGESITGASRLHQRQGAGPATQFPWNFCWHGVSEGATGP